MRFSFGAANGKSRILIEKHHEKPLDFCSVLCRVSANDVGNDDIGGWEPGISAARTYEVNPGIQAPSAGRLDPDIH